MIDFEHLADGTTLHIPAGVHRFSAPVRITGKRIRIVGEEGAVLRGTIPLRRKDFTQIRPGVFAAKVPQPVDAFYIGNRKYKMARYPKATDPDAPFGGWAADCTDPEKTKDWADPYGGYLHAMHRFLWGGFSYRIDGKSSDGTLRLSGGWQNNQRAEMHASIRFVENIPEEMTEPGEWVFDEKNMRILVRPVPGDDPDEAEAAAAHSFFTLDGCEDVTLENITFERTSRTFMETKEPLLRSDWTIFRGGAVLLRDAVRCRIDRCTFRDIGSNCVFADGNCRDVAVTRSRFTGIGASGVCFVGRTDAVRSPMFLYAPRPPKEEIDRTPGPRSDAFPKFCTVEDCLIDHIGTTEKQSAGVQISMSYGITVKNCTICHTPRAGINISEGTFGGHRIEGCDVFDTVRETGDHGSFNSWGRDRYLELGDTLADSKPFVRYDVLSPTVITRNRFRCDHGWDIDLDDGSSDYVITENLCLSGGLKLREGWYRTARHNILLNNTVHLHVWHPDSEDTVEENILFTPYAPVEMPKGWGRSVNRNILYAPDAAEPAPAAVLASQSGQDGDSVQRALTVRAPEEGDFRVADLPAFADFPTEFGVRYAPLRAAADTPAIPAIQKDPRLPGDGAHPLTLFGMTVKDIDNDDEMSVFGTPGHTGALVLSMLPDSPAEHFGIRRGDVLLHWGEREIRGADDLIGCGPGEPIHVLRQHKDIVIG